MRSVFSLDYDMEAELYGEGAGDPVSADGVAVVVRADLVTVAIDDANAKTSAGRHLSREAAPFGKRRRLFREEAFDDCCEHCGDRLLRTDQYAGECPCIRCSHVAEQSATRLEMESRKEAERKIKIDRRTDRRSCKRNKLPSTPPIIIERPSEYDALTLQLTRLLVRESVKIDSCCSSDEIDDLWTSMSYNLTEANLKVKLVSKLKLSHYSQ